MEESRKDSDEVEEERVLRVQVVGGWRAFYEGRGKHFVSVVTKANVSPSLMVIMSMMGFD